MTIGEGEGEGELAKIKINALEQPDPDEFIPERWTSEHVLRRLFDAFVTLGRCPPIKGPKTPGNAWPQYYPDFGDVRGWFENSTETEVAERQRDMNRTRVIPTSRQLAEMEAAMDWLHQVRGRDEAHSRVLGLWSACRAAGRSVGRLCDARGWSRKTFYRKRDAAAQSIANYLNETATPVF
jgi:hypothetical protein